MHVGMYSHPQAAAQSELAEVKQLYQAQVLEKGKMKQNLVEDSQESLVKVCLFLYECMHGDPILGIWVFIYPVGNSHVYVTLPLSLPFSFAKGTSNCCL